jgi:hypothetical protein
MSLVLRWRAPARRLTLRWRGPEGMVGAIARDPVAPIAGVIGPPGPAGGPPLRIDQASPAATWTLAHGLGRIPMVQTFLANGEPVIADIVATATQITVTHAQPQAGFVLAS